MGGRARGATLAYAPHDPQQSLAATALFPSCGGARHHRRPEGEVRHEPERRIAASGTYAREVRAAVGRRTGGADNSISSLAGSGGALSTPAIAFVSAVPRGGSAFSQAIGAPCWRRYLSRQHSSEYMQTRKAQQVLE